MIYEQLALFHVTCLLNEELYVAAFGDYTACEESSVVYFLSENPAKDQDLGLKEERTLHSMIIL